MTQPPLPPPPPRSRPLVPFTPSLRMVEHPDLSPVVTHFCSRARRHAGTVPNDILQMTPPKRLESILWDGHLRAFVTYSGGDPAVCFTEATWSDGINFLIRQRGYPPWGLVFSRNSVYNAGGGPVWYARTHEQRMLAQLGPRIQAWTVRLDVDSDWLEEREWRIPRTPQDPKTVVAISELELVGLLVGDPAWTGVRWAPCVPIGTTTGQPQWGYFYPPIPPGLSRLWWDASTAQLVPLAPLF
jgi:hypothetical protein